MCWDIKGCFPQQTRCLQTTCLLGSWHEPACPGAEQFSVWELTGAQNLVATDKSPTAGKPWLWGRPAGIRFSGRGWQMTRGDMPRLLLRLLQEDDGWWKPSLRTITSSTRPTTFPRPIDGITVLPVTLARNQGIILNYPLCLIPTISWDTKSCEFHLVPSSALCHHPSAAMASVYVYNTPGS